MSSSAGRSDLFRNYRFITADKSQVCDGRNLESLRIYESSEPPKTTRKGVASDSDKAKEVESRVSVGRGKGCRPTSSRSKERNNEKVQPRQQEKAQPKVSQGRQQPSTKPKANSFLPNPSFFESDHTLDDSWLPELNKEKQSQAASPEVKKSVRKERSESRDSTESRPGSQSRRSSTGDSSLTGSSHSSGKKVTMRKLSEPMHRCSLTNASVNGIMRPARYSSINLSGMVDASPPSTNPSIQRIRKSTSQLSLSTYATPSLSKSTSSNRLSQGNGASLSTKRSSYDSLKPIKPRRTMSVADMANENWNSHPTPVDDQEAKDEWVASGVAFSKNMEVYVFKK